MIGLVMLGSDFRWGVTSVDIAQPQQQYSKVGGPILDAGDITLAPVSVNALGDVTGTVPYDWNNGWVFSMRMIGNTSLTFTNPLNGMDYRIMVSQDGTGSRVLTLPGAVIYPGGSAPSPLVTAAASSLTEIRLLYNGTNYIATVNKSGLI